MTYLIVCDTIWGRPSIFVNINIPTQDYQIILAHTVIVQCFLDVLSQVSSCSNFTMSVSTCTVVDIGLKIPLQPRLLCLSITMPLDLCYLQIILKKKQ